MANENRESPEMDETQDTPPSNPPANPPGRRQPPPREPETPPEDSETLQAELQRTRAALAKANKEATTSRLRLQELETAEEQRSTASLSELDRLKKDLGTANQRAADAERRAESAEAELVRLRIDVAVERYASNAGFEYPDIAPSLIDRRLVTIDEETGKVEGVKDAVDRLAKAKPNLVVAKGGGGTPPREGPPRRSGGGSGGRGRDDRHDEIEADLRATGNYV